MAEPLIHLVDIDAATREVFIRYRRSAREHLAAARIARRIGGDEAEARELGRAAMMGAAAERELSCPRWGAGT